MSMHSQRRSVNPFWQSPMMVKSESAEAWTDRTQDSTREELAMHREHADLGRTWARLVPRSASLRTTWLNDYPSSGWSYQHTDCTSRWIRIVICEDWNLHQICVGFRSSAENLACEIMWRVNSVRKASCSMVFRISTLYFGTQLEAAYQEHSVVRISDLTIRSRMP